MFFLKFIFFIFIVFLALILWVAYTLYKQITRVRRRFNPEDLKDEVKVDGNTIIDHRQKQERKPVIADDEGEYVDFTESDTTK